MIVDAIIALIVAVIGWATGAVNAVWNTVDWTPVTTGAAKLAGLNRWVPIDQFVIIITLVATIATAMIIMKFVLYIIQVWPGKFS